MKINEIPDKNWNEEWMKGRGERKKETSCNYEVRTLLHICIENLSLVPQGSSKALRFLSKKL